MFEDYKELLDEWYGNTTDLKELCGLHTKILAECEKQFEFMIECHTDTIKRSLINDKD